MSASIIQQIPALTSSSINEFVSGLIMAANKGVRIFITAKLYEYLKQLFNQLGIRVREVSNKIPVDTYILIKSSGIRVKIEVYENGKRVNSISTTIKGFEKALLDVIEKRKGKDEAPSFYELVLPEEFEVTVGSEGEEDSDGSGE